MTDGPRWPRRDRFPYSGRQRGPVIRRQARAGHGSIAAQTPIASAGLPTSEPTRYTPARPSQTGCLPACPPCHTCPFSRPTGRLSRLRNEHNQPAGNVDDARLRPHLRGRARLERLQLDALKDGRAAAVADGRDVVFPSRPLTSPTAAGDERRLRGIPAIGRNVAGATGGSMPHRDAPSLRGRAA